MAEVLKENETDDGLFMALDEEENDRENKYLLFNLGKEIYGIGIVQVTEIIELQDITSVPDVPEYVKGVINFRGGLIPILDLRLRFEMEERIHDDRTCIIIVNIDDKSVGLIVDTVSEVQDIGEESIEPPPDFRKDGGGNHYIHGLGKVEGRVTILIDAENIVNDGELATMSDPTEHSD